MSDLVLRVNGKDFAGWQSIRVTRSIESIAGSFDLSVSDRWSEQGQPWQILEEDECTVLIAGQKIITGYVDRRSIRLSASDHSLSVKGKDKAGSLVECSAKLPHWEYLNTSVLTFVTRIAATFGIPVTLQAGIKLGAAPSKLTIEPGETAFDAIEKACRHAALLAVSDGHGGILLCRAGTTRASAIVEGKNLLAVSAEFDVAGRMAKYFVLGQHQGSDKLPDATAASIEATATDLTVKRTERILVVRPEGDVTPAQAKQRAQWEATVRAARGDAVSVTVQGWTEPDGTPWPVNAFLRLRSPSIGVDADLLISEVTFNMDETGSTTQLTLKRPDAFKPEPAIPKDSNMWKEIKHGV